MRYRSAKKTVFSAKEHAAARAKYQRAVPVEPVARRSEESVAEVGHAHDAGVIEPEVMGHMRLLAEVPPALPLSR
jgi:putative transposase